MTSFLFYAFILFPVVRCFSETNTFEQSEEMNRSLQTNFQCGLVDSIVGIFEFIVDNDQENIIQEINCRRDFGNLVGGFPDELPLMPNLKNL